jgi:hypothetical protein
VLLEQVAERLFGDFFDALHLIARHQVDRIPGFTIELQPLADQVVRLARCLFLLRTLRHFKTP